MASPQSLTMVAVKIFVKLNMIAPMRIVCVRMILTQTRTKPVFVQRENRGQAPSQLMRHLPQVHPVTRARGKFNRETVPVKMMITLQGLHQQVVDRKPDGASPIRVPTKKTALRFAGFIRNGIVRSIKRNAVRLTGVDSGKRAYAVWRKKFVLVQNVAQNAL